jgi:hypothetical protein
MQHHSFNVAVAALAPLRLAALGLSEESRNKSALVSQLPFGYLEVMNTLSEVEAAVMSLPVQKQKALYQKLALRLDGKSASTHARGRRALKAASRPALEGLPAELSTATRERVRALVTGRHASNR